MGKQPRIQHAGVIEGIGPNLSCVVHLDSGEQVQARIPRHIARLMLRVVPGDRVLIESRGPAAFVVLGHEQAVRDQLIVAHLTQDKRSVSDWFLVGDSVCFWGRYGDIGDWLTSDDRLSNAVRDYLRRINAPVYESHSEALRVHAELGARPAQPRE